MAHTIISSFMLNLVVKRQPLLGIQSVMYIDVKGNRNKHYKPEFRKHRALKNQLLPMYTEEAELPREGPGSLFYNFKMHGRYWNEPRTVASYTQSLIDPYDPVKDELKSWMTPKGGWEIIQGRRKDKKAIRDIQSYDQDFEIVDFIEECDQIYIKANQSIADKDEDKMLDYLTPLAYNIARSSTENKRIRWSFLQSLEPPKPLRVRAVAPTGTDEAFAQITVRFHTQQTLAIYDRFGRLMKGSEILAKDVLEIVVFEKQLSHAFGKWRIHEKIPVPGTARSEIPKTRISGILNVGEEQQKEIETAETVTPVPEPKLITAEQKQ